jgi:hypothetical protein
MNRYEDVSVKSKSVYLLLRDLERPYQEFEAFDSADDGEEDGNDAEDCGGDFGGVHSDIERYVDGIANDAVLELGRVMFRA